MLKRLTIFILVACLVTISTILIVKTSHKENNSKQEFYIIGTIHSMHFNPDNHYTIIDLQNQISKLNPDLVCGEITPEAFNQAMEGYFPPEAAFLAQMSSAMNYRFVPVDWRLDYATQSKAEKDFPPSIKEKITSFGNANFATFNPSNYESAYDFFHSTLNLHIVDSLYEKIICTDSIADLAQGSWHERNKKIVENGLRTAKNAHRVVFVFGSDHIPQIQRQLKKLGIEAQVPERLFTPSNNLKVPEKVLTRWKRNLENLKLIRDKKIPTTENNYQKVINSKRIQDLELAIQKSS